MKRKIRLALMLVAASTALTIAPASPASAACHETSIGTDGINSQTYDCGKCPLPVPWVGPGPGYVTIHTCDAA